MPLLAPETRRRLEDAYRGQLGRGEPLNDTRAAREARCARHAAARQRNHGDPQRGWKPITAQLEEEAAARRTVVAENGRADAARQLQDEAALVRNVRVASGAVFKLAAAVLPGALDAAQRISADLKSGKLAGDPATAMSVLRQFVGIVGRASEIASDAQVMEHRLLGKPTDILGVSTEAGNVDAAAVAAEARALLDDLARAESEQADVAKLPEAPAA